MRLRYTLLPALAGISLLATGCEPANITEARDQLGRGAARTVTYQLPIARDTFYIDSMLGSDTTRTADGLRAVTFPPETLAVAVSEKLAIDAVTLDTVIVDIPDADLNFPSGTVPFGPETTDSALAKEPRLQDLDTVVAEAGTLTITTRNKLVRTTVSYTVTLNGFKNASGVTLSGGGTVPAGDGTNYSSHIVTFDLAGVTIVPDSVRITFEGSVTWSGGAIPAGQGDDALTQTGVGNIVVRRLAGTLDPAVTPELNVSVEEAEEIDIDVDSVFGDIADALEDARLNDVVMGLTVRNGLGTKLTFSNFTLGVVELTAAGAVPRDGSGNPVFETDSLGNPIQFAIVDTGLTTLTVAARSGATPTVKTVGFQAAPVIDRVLDLLLQDKRAGLVAVGMATAGDATAGVKSSVSRTDSVSLTLGTTVALDITVPTSGVTFGATEVQEGVDLDSADANQISSRVVSASARSVVTNQTPFGVQVLIALVPDSQPPGVDADSIFRMSNRVELGPVDLSPAQVDSKGRVTQAVTDTVSVSMTGPQSLLLFGPKFTSAVRVTLFPNPTASGRGAILPTDRVTLSAGASVTIRMGSN